MPAKAPAQREAVKYQIQERFEKHVRNRVPDLGGYDPHHDGAEGDWLTRAMGLVPDARNAPDLLGFEMKKGSRYKTTFGDWSPTSSLYKVPNKQIERDDFIELFGMPNPKRNNRSSWSGSVFPKVGHTNFAGQIIKVDLNGNIFITYTTKDDTRAQKSTIMHRFPKRTTIELARWDASSIKSRVENKFGVFGWFRCLKDKRGRYQTLQFGPPLKYGTFLECFQRGEIFIDCGMHQGNNRPYMSWRATNQIWDALAEK